MEFCRRSGLEADVVSEDTISWAIAVALCLLAIAFLVYEKNDERGKR